MVEEVPAWLALTVIAVVTVYLLVEDGGRRWRRFIKYLGVDR